MYNEAFNVVKGEEFFVNGEIVFPPTFETTPETMGEDGTYRTYFGPSVAHNGTIYGNSNDNVSLAMRRLTAARGNLDLDEAYRAQQAHYIQQSLLFLAEIQKVMTERIHFKGTRAEAEEHHADPHIKRLLRIDAWEQIRIGSWKGLHMSDPAWLRNLTYKMKKDEVAKNGKYPRMIGDAGIAASLRGFVLTKKMKKVMAEYPIAYEGGTIEFCAKPEPAKLVEVFSKLIDPPGRFYFVYFSDDSCLSFRDSTGHVQIFNVDISKCDASHGSAIFEALQAIAPDSGEEGMRELINQCKMPIQIRDLNDPKRKVVLEPKRPRLYSGVTITTLINNLANVMIAKAFAEIKNPTCSRDVIHAAGTAGYLVTCEVCEVIQDIQFLKHSPVLDSDGNLRPMLNLGVLLRSSGQCKGDLPGRKRDDLETRARMFQGGLLKGMYPHTRFQLLSNLKENTLEPSDKVMRRITDGLRFKVTGDSDSYWVDSEQVFRRYRLSADEIRTVEEGYGRGSYCDMFANPALEAILTKDYELSVVYRDELE